MQFVVPILLFMKYLTSYQHKPAENENICKTHVFLDCPKYINLIDELSTDLREGHLKAFALLHIRYRSHTCLVRFSLLLSGDIELNPGPIKNPCTICQGNVSIRGLFCKSFSIGCHKKCSTIAHHKNYICLQCQIVDMPSISGNLKDLPFSNICSFDELSDRNTDYSLMWQLNSKP